MNELQECHRLVWAFRKEIEPYWATPDPLNSLRYAFCEAAEAMDAWLRAERPNDSRNNERQNDVLDELADCAIMLLTAVTNYGYRLTLPTSKDIHVANAPYSVDIVSCRVSDLLEEYSHAAFFNSSRNNYSMEMSIGNILNIIANYPGMELKQRIQGRLERIVKKHVPLDKQKVICEKVGITCLLAEEIKKLKKQHLANLGIVNEPPM